MDWQRLQPCSPIILDNNIVILSIVHSCIVYIHFIYPSIATLYNQIYLSSKLTTNYVLFMFQKRTDAATQLYKPLSVPDHIATIVLTNQQHVSNQTHQ
mmetsp:Transcript_802/g.957  ORF Transcript_802/g.957 Transcript_802/m.957 type:complete len:98 (+) Transcript_802:139-432(+)